jgi:hypothetical protein
VTGTIHLGGGGDPSDEESLWRAMLQGKRRVLYWPFALPPARIREAEAWLAGATAPASPSAGRVSDGERRETRSIPQTVEVDDASG